MQVPLTKPYIGDEECQAVADVLKSGWLIQGAKVMELEGQFAEYVGAKYARASSSCTTALHMALLALGIGQGDNVIVPSYTFVATANAVEYTGAKPVFIDIMLDTYNISMAELAKALHYGGKKYKAIIPVHLFGLCAPMRELMVMTRSLNMFVVEDAACALGSFCPIGMAGNMGEAGCFSLHPRKSITTGEGGMLTTNDERIAKMAQAYRDFGFMTTNLERHKSGSTVLSEVEVLGYNYRMTDIQASIGVEQMKRFKWMLAKRIERAEIYNRELGSIEWLKIPFIPEGYNHTYQSYSVLVNPDRRYIMNEEYILKAGAVRDKVMAKLKDVGIATRQGTHAVHMLGYYRKKYELKPTDFINTYAADRMAMTIPLYPHMTDDEQGYVIEQIKSIRV